MSSPSFSGDLMAGTDTVVGIVGAVLLASVMVGVFVYEYNNAPAMSPDGPAAAQAAFTDKHPNLNATGDLDGDKKLNFEDDDLDGDGKNNTIDTDTSYSPPAFSGSVPQSTTASTQHTTTVKVEQGLEMLTVTVTFSTVTPPPIPSQISLTLTILDASGATVGEPASSSSGSVTVSVDGAELPPGTYTIRVSQGNPRPSVDYDGQSVLNYGAHSH